LLELIHVYPSEGAGFGSVLRRAPAALGVGRREVVGRGGGEGQKGGEEKGEGLHRDEQKMEDGR
jgi:hypothetical protein